MNLIKNGSTPTLMVFLVDQTDGSTAESGLTLADVDVYISKNGGAFAAATNTGGAGGSDLANVGRGWYSLSLTATETNTDGELVIEAEDPANSRTWRKVYQVYTNLLHDDEHDDIADHVLRRNFANVRAGNGDSLSDEQYNALGALLALSGTPRISGSNLNVYREDETTVAYARTVSTDAGANPVTGLT